ncbi:MAG: biotin--[acetyl-CoA-carboxylase] ligase [Microbacterium sp.]|uniref:biotin--[acetyl-CoA-carboxylase] ligase n=1 Tax=Microbacterium sp. TaxID=51671 RepID=UPI0039E2BD90
MPVPAASYPRAAALSPRLEPRERAGSTNADLVAAVSSAPAEWPHLSVLLTTSQTSGRGRLGRTWTAAPGAALAVSVLVRVPLVPPESRGWIPLAAGAAMTCAIARQVPGTGVKWPNDVLVAGLKICGILAEGVPGEPHAVVVGSGVNTRMAPVDLPVPTATSFAALGAEADDDALVADYLAGLRDRLDALADARGDADASGLRAELQRLCVTLGRDVAVSLPGGDTLRGRAEGLDASGRLLVVADGAVTAVSAGDVVHVR